MPQTPGGKAVKNKSSAFWFGYGLLQIKSLGGSGPRNCEIVQVAFFFFSFFFSVVVCWLVGFKFEMAKKFDLKAGGPSIFGVSSLSLSLFLSFFLFLTPF